LGRDRQPGSAHRLERGLGDVDLAAETGRFMAGVDLYTLQWTSMMILIYFTEGIVRAWGDKVTPWLGWGEVAIVVVYFLCAILYVQPYKKAARQAARELLEKVNTSKTR
jgi:hypothetical protein